VAGADLRRRPSVIAARPGTPAQRWGEGCPLSPLRLRSGRLPSVHGMAQWTRCQLSLHRNAQPASECVLDPRFGYRNDAGRLHLCSASRGTGPADQGHAGVPGKACRQPAKTSITRFGSRTGTSTSIVICTASACRLRHGNGSWLRSADTSPPCRWIAAAHCRRCG
jgi:hypothetical protein